MKRVYICIPYDTALRAMAKAIQNDYEARGYVVMNPFGIMAALKRSYQQIGWREPQPEDYLRERLANVEFCEEIVLCHRWADDAVCMEEVDKAIACGLKFGYRRF